MRHDNRENNEIRPIKNKRHFTRAADGSVLIQAGKTKVLCTVSLSQDIPAWLEGQHRGWITAEYSMLPGSTSPRKTRDRGGVKVDGRSSEIQRLIGRSFRAVADTVSLGEWLVTIDCDVLEADGGTRTLAITGAQIALIDALRAKLSAKTRLPMRGSIAAVSVGIVDGQPMLDLDYKEDSSASVDMNVVMTGTGKFVEIQGTGEEATFSDKQLGAMLKLARQGIQRLTQLQKNALGRRWPFE
jgi:ribonuclease PH